MFNMSKLSLAAAVAAAVFSGAVSAAEISFVSGATGKDIENFKAMVKPWEDKTGNTVSILSLIHI